MNTEKSSVKVQENLEMFKAMRPLSTPALFWREIKNDRLALVGLFTITFILLFCVIYGGYVGSDAAMEIDLWNRRMPPSWQEGGMPGMLLGTDEGGRDMFKLLTVSARNSIALGWSIAVLSLLISIVVGLIAGYFGGQVDNIIMRLVDTWMLVPSTMFIIVMVTILDRTMINFIFLLTIFGWTGGARLIRALALQQRNMDYVAASKTLGTRSYKIILRKVFPNMVSIVAAQIVLTMSTIIGIEVGLTLLGFGMRPGTPSIGYLLTNAMQFSNLAHRWWMWAPTVVLLLVIMLSINFVGQAISRAADPRQRMV
jgi:peptide/nickel transport system permease protein